ncbi:TonB-dependent siderophore receptor [Sphingobium vermicomposti]|uniref:Outer membrane receptor for ferric coprogen and ferric-rhodotorulic acid n=1 Tax=Sphingobium vermicomposti TaxID=529005 RepID=A0A846M669_9SPHN|nr:TonB-dependent siderophore receptor [Sphingobium vermicomposti]NIJ15574.1 outer membrane receptor for ferric coprogen and ferric-rhodotorulic acid [Sphingobium vermicomposti]
MIGSFHPAFRLALLAASFLSAPAIAQDAEENASGNETIVVYGSGIGSNAAATGLDLTPRETPQSLTIITREQIDDQAASTIADVLEYTTGLSVKRVDRGRNLLSARGFDITNFQIDGLPFATGNVGLEESSTVIYDRVEVVRGSVGLLQGAGEPSASINMVRRQADAREFTGTVTLEAASWDHVSATVDVSTPLTSDGSVRARFAAEVYRQDAFVDLESSKGFTLYGTISADVGPSTRLRVGGSYQKDERNGVMWAQLPYWYADGTVADWSRSKTTGADWNAWDTAETSAFLTIEQDVALGWMLKGDVSYFQQTEDSKLIWLWGSPDKASGIGMDVWPYWYLAKPKQWNLNLQLKGNYQLFGRSHELVVGAMYNHLKTGWTNRDPDAATVAPVGDFNAWDGSYPEPTWGLRYRMSGFGTTKQTAFYGVTRFRLLDPVKLILGGRLSSWVRDEEEALYTAEPYRLKKNVFTPYAGLVVDLNKFLSAYASYTSIFNPQTVRDREGRYLDPLEGANYEAGLKADLLDGRLRLSGAVFRIEQDNFAVPDIGYFVPGTTDVASKPAMGTVSKGYEFEMQGEVLPGWDISAGWSHFKATDADGIDVQAHQPRKVFRMATKYEFGGTLDGFSFGGSARWESRPPQTAANPATGETEKVGQKAYWLANLMGAYDIDDRLSLQINVNNVFDKRYYNTNSWFGGYIYGEPRNVRATLSYGF